MGRKEQKNDATRDESTKKDSEAKKVRSDDRRKRNGTEKDDREGDAQSRIPTADSANAASAAAAAAAKLVEAGTNNDSSVATNRGRNTMAMKPMSKEEYDREQSKVREVYDPLSG